MDEEQLAKIESAVAKCLSGCDDITPFKQLSAFINSLKDDPEWTDRDIIEVQTRVIRVLLYRSQHPPRSNT